MYSRHIRQWKQTIKKNDIQDSSFNSGVHFWIQYVTLIAELE